MDQRNVVDAVVFIALGTFLATYALLLVSSRHPHRRLAWSSGRDPVTGRDPLFMTFTLVGVFSVIRGGTGLRHHTPTWLAVLLAVGPPLVLRAGRPGRPQPPARRHVRGDTELLTGIGPIDVGRRARGDRASDAAGRCHSGIVSWVVVDRAVVRAGGGRLRPGL